MQTNKVVLSLKRWISLGLAACLLCALTGCKRSEPEPLVDALVTEQPPIQALITPVPTPTPEPTEQPMPGEEAQQALSVNIGNGEAAYGEITPPSGITFTEEEPALPWDDEELPADEPSPSPTAAPIEDPYTYSSLTNQTLKVKFLYPEGWTSDPSTDTITMVEPVPEGKVPARFSVTSFEYEYKERDISTGRLKDHLTDYVKSVVKVYNEYQLGDTGYELAFAESTSIYAKYIAIKGNAYIEGITAVGYGKNGRVYCMHFCCEQDDYEGYADLIEKLAANVMPISK